MPKSEQGVRRTSKAQEDYLKAIYQLGGSDEPVPTSRLAQELNLSPASISEMLDKLDSLGLVDHNPYRGVRLTAEGEALALEMVRHHRLLETYLVNALGYGWDEVHEEADRLEHAISERLEERMWTALGRPRVDPHGDPIPTADGRLRPRGLRPLVACATGERVVLERVSDRDPEKLRAISALGLNPGARVRVVAASRWEGPIQLAVGKRLLEVPLGLARALFVES
jgi:DtxR family transcriptional regulator, Mn-dependent transcriptional regulator